MDTPQNILYIIGGMNDNCFNFCQQKYNLSKYFTKVICLCNPSMTNSLSFKPILAISKALFYMEPGFINNIKRASIKTRKTYDKETANERTSNIIHIYNVLRDIDLSKSKPYLDQSNKLSINYFYKILKLFSKEYFKHIYSLYPNHNLPQFEDLENDLILIKLRAFLNTSFTYKKSKETGSYYELNTHINKLLEIFETSQQMNEFIDFINRLIVPNVSLMTIKNEIETQLENPYTNILVLGISYGGYLASKLTQLMMNDVHEDLLQRFTCVTFGAMNIVSLPKNAPFVNYKSRFDIVNILQNTNKFTITIDLKKHPQNDLIDNETLKVDSNGFIIPKQNNLKTKFYFHNCIVLSIMINIISNYLQFDSEDTLKLIKNMLSANYRYFYNDILLPIKKYNDINFSFENRTIYDIGICL